MTDTLGTKMSPARRAGFTSALMLAMGLSTFVVTGIGLIASFLIDEFGITRRDIGVIVAVNGIGAALLSPPVGRIADRLGGTRSMVWLYTLSAAAFFVIGVAPAYWVLLVGAFIGSIMMAAGNPATNKAIATALPPGRRAMVTGLKQSGVQVGAFLGGSIVPLVAETAGWRTAIVGVAVVAAVGIPASVAIFPRGEAIVRQERGQLVPALPESINWLAVYGFLMGSASGTFTFIPLFAEEALGTSVRTAGFAIAVIALVGGAARILWALYADRRGRHLRALAAMAVVSMAGVVIMLLATRTSLAFLWLGAVAIGLGMVSWNAVGMLAAMELAGQAAAGRASGRVLLGFLSGIGIAPVVYGQTVDSTGSYDLMWAISLTVSAAALAVTVLWRRRAAEMPARRGGDAR